MHFVGFIIRIHHDARSSECQIRERNSRNVNFLTYKPKKLRLISSIRIFFVYSENLKEGYYLVVSVVDGKVILKCILKKLRAMERNRITSLSMAETRCDI